MAATMKQIDRKSMPCALVKALPAQSSQWFAFYSSVTDAITTDPACMVVPVDDHMVHRGHAVFDTANLGGGRVYGLSFHIERLLRSAARARIEHDYDAATIKSIILHTVAASGVTDDAIIRYWLSAGRGNFGISPKGLGKAHLYVVVCEYKGKVGLLNGVKECTVSVPLKPKLLAELKSTNYLLNALTTMEAESKSCFLGVQVDEDGFLMESSIANVAIVDEHGKLRAPPFDGILRGTTLTRATELAQPLIDQGLLTGVDLENKVHQDDVARAREMIGFGGGGCYPIIEFNGQPVGTGQPGPVFKFLYQATLDDYQNPQLSDEVPYALYRKNNEEEHKSAGGCGHHHHHHDHGHGHGHAHGSGECCKKKAAAAAAAGGDCNKCGGHKQATPCSICGSTRASCNKGVTAIMHSIPVVIVSVAATLGFLYARGMLNTSR